MALLLWAAWLTEEGVSSLAGVGVRLRHCKLSSAPGTESPGGMLNSSQLTSDMKHSHLLVFTSLLSMSRDTNVVDLMGPKQAAC